MHHIPELTLQFSPSINFINVCFGKSHNAVSFHILSYSSLNSRGFKQMHNHTNISKSKWNISENECRTTRLGNDYIGDEKITSSGRECRPWTSDASIKNLQALLPDSDPRDAMEKCRVLAGMDMTQPSCLVESDRAHGHQLEECSIHYCGNFNAYAQSSPLLDYQG